MKWTLKKISVKDLKEYPKNPRQMSEKGLKDLEKSIKRFGVAEPLVLNTDHTICGGHGRKKILEKLNITEVDCYIPDKTLTEKQFQELNVRLNKNIAGEFDYDILANEFEIDELLEWGFEEKDLGMSFFPGDHAEDEVPEIPKTALSKLGDIFLIDGGHRIMCGDSTKADDVERLMDGKKADLLFTDPPYGVGYEEKAKRNGNKSHGKVSNDDNVDSAKQIWDGAFKNIANALDEGGAYYVCAPQGGDQMMMMMMMMMANTIPCKHELIWIKNNPVFSMGRLDYDYQHEPILYGWKGAHKFFAKGEFTKSIWNIERPQSSKLHPTMKPVKLICNAIMNSTQGSNNIVIDFFSGSGSTLIACEQTKRICYGMEIDPIYIDVILNRYKNLFSDAEFKCLNREFDFERLFEKDLEKIA